MKNYQGKQFYHRINPDFIYTVEEQVGRDLVISWEYLREDDFQSKPIYDISDFERYLEIGEWVLIKEIEAEEL